MKLLVVEAPGKVKTLKKLLERIEPGAWDVVPSFGHIRDLPRNELGLDEHSFALTYEYLPPTRHPTDPKRVWPGSEEHVDKIRSKMERADEVYLATDPDREGEAIAWHLREVLDLGEDYKRITYSEVTEKGLRNAIANPMRIDDRRVQAQEARRALDRLIGYKVSPILSDVLGQSASAGRVQSVACRMIVEREADIQRFKALDHFGAAVHFDDKKWKAEWVTKAFANEAGFVLDEGLARLASTCRQFRVAASDNAFKRKAPPAPLNTARLHQAASVALKMNPSETEKVAQKLYEQGAITYWRTDSVNFSEESVAQLREAAAANGLAVSEKVRTWREKASAQVGHEAMRPAHMQDLDAGETEAEKALYQLIWRHSLATQLEDAVYSVNTLRLEALDVHGQDGRAFEFQATGRVLTSPGWKALTPDDATEDAAEADPEADAGGVPLLAVDGEKAATGGELLKKRTRPPERYTLASLVKALEDRGIGRPATYGAVTGNILAKGYVSLDKQRKLLATPLGVEIVLALINTGFAFIELDFTRDMELQLDYIAEGSATYISVVAEAWRILQVDLARIASNPAAKPKHTCHKCGEAMRRIAAPQRVFWVCSGVKKESCDVYLDDVNGRPLLPVDHACPKCKAKLKRWRRKAEKGGGNFWACPTEECGTFMDDVDGKPVPRQVHPCPKCKAPLRRCKRTKEKGGGHFWRCTGADCLTFLEDSRGKPVEPKKAVCPKCKAVLVRAKGKKAHFWRHLVKGACLATFFDENGKLGKAMPPRPAA